MLNRTAVGFGGLALRGMLADECRADSVPARPLAPRSPHFVARAKRLSFKDQKRATRSREVGMGNPKTAVRKTHSVLM